MKKPGLVADLIGAALLIAVGGGTALLSLDYGLFGRNGLIRPGFMPFVAGALMALFGVAVGLGALRQHLAVRRSVDAGTAEEGAPKAEEGSEADELPPSRAGRRVAVVFALTLATIFAAPYLGFVLAFGLLIFVLLVLVEREALWIGIVVGGVASFATWLVFVFFLRIPLPGGIF